MAGVKGRGGRPAKPVEVKRRTGNPGKRALPGGAELAVVAPMERTMADYTPLAAFDQVMATGVGWLAVTDAPSLALLRELLEERDGIKAAIASGVGDRKSLRELDKQIITLLSQLGFDPAARSRLGLAEVRAASKMEALRASQTQRLAAKVVDEGSAR